MSGARPLPKSFGAAPQRVEYELDFVSGQPKHKKQKGSHEA